MSGGSSVDVSQIKMTYRDKNINQDIPFLSSTGPTNSTYVVTQPDGVTLLTILDTGKLAKFNVAPPADINTPYHTFALEIKPPTGGVLLLERTCPARIDQVTDLN